MADSSRTEEITGQLLHVRPLSKRLAFGDLELEGGGIVELVFKLSSEEGPGLASVGQALKAACLGDTVSLEGRWENDGASGKPCAFRVTSDPTVVVSWKSTNNDPFRPRYVGRGKDPGAGATVSDSNEGASGTKESAPGLKATGSSGLCKFYLNTRQCPRGDGCRFEHSNDPAVRTAWVEARRREKLERASAESGDGLDPHGKAAKVGPAPWDLGEVFCVLTLHPCHSGVY